MSDVQKSFFRLEHIDETPSNSFGREALPMQALSPQILAVGKSKQTHENTRTKNRRQVEAKTEKIYKQTYENTQTKNRTLVEAKTERKPKQKKRTQLKGHWRQVEAKTEKNF